MGSSCLRSGFVRRDGQLAKINMPFRGGIPRRARPFRQGILKYCATGVTFFVYVKFCLYFCIFEEENSALNISMFQQNSI